ncbi:MAG: hypothetical protein EPN79_15960 [Burkholderiaceae bacterium]|nr:MAG: hypothetical protein EPN79_15960 [Burkholderiaceae bacterium]
MSNVKGFPGSNNVQFDPDNVLAEEDLSASGFAPQPPHQAPPAAPGGTPARPSMVKYLVIGIFGVIAVGTVVMTLKPTFAPKPAASRRAVAAAAPAGLPQAAQGESPMAQGAAMTAPTGGQMAATAPADASLMQAFAAQNAQPATAVPVQPTPQTPTPQTTTAPQLPPGTDAVAAVPNSAPAAAVQQPTAPQSDADTAPAKRIDVLEARMSTLEAQLATIQKDLHALASERKPAPETQSAKHVKRSAGALAKVASRSSTRAAAPHTSTTHKGASGEAPTLKAVVTGRAWFQTTAGTTITASVGDNVPGYGTVEAIDADAGVVRFTNGAVAH